MDILLLILAILCGLVGMIGSIVPVLPGPPLSFIGLLLARWSGYGNFSDRFLLVWGIVTLAVTVADNFLPVWMTKKGGGSRMAVRGSLAGLLVGMVFFPPFGLILGAFVGAFLGELYHDSRDASKAFRVAFYSFVAFLVGTGAKLIVSAVLLFYIVRSLF